MRLTMKRCLAFLLGGTFVSAMLVFAYLKSEALLEGPMIELSSPVVSGPVADPLVIVTGIARNTKEITLDDRPIFIDLNGNFAEPLVLLPGYNIIVLNAKDVRGKEVRKTIELFHTPASSSSATTTIVSGARATAFTES